MKNPQLKSDLITCYFCAFLFWISFFCFYTFLTRAVYAFFSDEHIMKHPYFIVISALNTGSLQTTDPNSALHLRTGCDLCLNSFSLNWLCKQQLCQPSKMFLIKWHFLPSYSVLSMYSSTCLALVGHLRKLKKKMSRMLNVFIMSGKETKYSWDILQDKIKHVRLGKSSFKLKLNTGSWMVEIIALSTVFEFEFRLYFPVWRGKQETYLLL